MHHTWTGLLTLAVEDDPVACNKLGRAKGIRTAPSAAQGI
jgi:hypothetical protein